MEQFKQLDKKIIERESEIGNPIIWMPHDCWLEETISKCKSINI